jgi:hypothetical protein
MSNAKTLSRVKQTRRSSIPQKLLRLMPVFAAVLLLASPTRSQFYFGKNKVQYDSFDWQVMTTEHFRVYFYKDASEIAEIAADIAENSYPSLAAQFRLEIRKKIPLVIYSSPRHFSQTNIVPGRIPESVGGFTEFLKGRVVVPFHGSYFDFEHVIRHEMVHVFMLTKLDEVLNRQNRGRYGWPPLWFTEGLAEFWSESWDTEADMIIKDMVLNDRLLSISELWRVQGTYFMYKLGQSICAFIDSTYGTDKLTLLFDNWPKGKKFEEVVEITLGDNLEKVSQKWHYALKKRFYPEMAKLDFPDMESKPLTFEGIAVKGVPITWYDGEGTTDWIVFMANRMGYSGLYMKPRTNSEGGVRTLVKGERSSRFESLHLLRSGIDANDSGLVVFSSKSKDRDVIYIYDLNKGKVTYEFEPPGLIAAISPRLSRDGRRVVFSGVTRSGASDIYLLDMITGTMSQITDDIYYDIDPTFGPDNETIVFSSDRGAEGRSGALNLHRVSVSGTGIQQLTFGNYRDLTPEVAEEGIYFSSNREGSYNLFLLSYDGELTRQSTYVTGAFDPRLTPDGKGIVYTGFQGMRYRVYEMRRLKEPQPVAMESTMDSVTWRPKKISTEISSASIKYDTDYSFDIAQSTIAYDPVYGTLGGVQGMVSDMLGNHQFYFLLANTADTKDEFLQSFNVGITYLNREKRINWGIGLFHIYDEYYNDVDQFYDERQAGGIGLVSYPVSTFARFDFTTFARYSKKDRRFGLDIREAFLVTNLISWVHDNSLWDISGPIEGHRYNLTAGITTEVDKSRNFNRQFWADIRHYFRLGRYSAFANRLFAYHSSGREPQRIYFGGSWNFRGYNRREFYNRNILFASNELRFPLIDNLLIGFPIGGLGFQAIRGALFFDAGSAWDDSFDQFIGSFGAGFRVSLGYLVLLRFDFSRTTDFQTISPSTDFDFFFGWNF